jgi:hypothetical protein
MPHLPQGKVLTTIHLIDTVLVPDMPSDESSDIADIGSDLLGALNITTGTSIIANSSLALALSNRTIAANLTLGNFSLSGNMSAPATLAPVNSSLWKDSGYIMALAEGRGESYLRSASNPEDAVKPSDSTSSTSSAGGVNASLAGVIGVVAGAVLLASVIIGAGIAMARRQLTGALARTSSRLISALTGRPYRRVGGYDGGMDVELPPNAFRGDSSTAQLV